jgi:hypothetical protein
VIARTMPTLAELTSVLDGIRAILTTVQSLAPELVRGHPSWQEVKNRTLLMRRSMVRLAIVQQRWLITRALAKEKSRHAVRPRIALDRAAVTIVPLRSGIGAGADLPRLLAAEGRELVGRRALETRRDRFARVRPSTPARAVAHDQRAAGAGASGD